MTTKTSPGAVAALILLTSVELLVFLEVSIVNVALPAMAAALGLGQAALAWVINAYQLTFGGFQLVAGRAADLFGRRRMFRAGLALFILGSLLAAIADGAAVLLAARGLQGLGAAIVIPAELALLAGIFTDPAAYRRAMGVWSAMAALGAGAGVALGGLLTDWLGWPSVFWINVPIGLLALALSGRLLPADPARPAGGRRPLGAAGALAATTALIGLVYVAAELPARGWDPLTAGVSLLTVAAGTLFAVDQRRSASPVLPPALFRIGHVRAGAVASFLVGAVHVPAFVLLTMVLQEAMGYSAAAAGLAVLPVAAANLAAARTAVPWAMGRFGPRAVLAAGMALLAAGLAGHAALLQPGAGYLTAVLPSALLIGAGLPAVFVAATAPAVRAAGDDLTGAASGLVNTAQRVGAALGVTGLLLAADAWAGSAGGGTAAVADGLRLGLAGAAALAVAGVLCALLLVPREPGAKAAERKTEPETAETAEGGR
ncbi:MFS transporter [Nocardiopsis sp. CNT-189]|uniref:MFS transporter n=1 Tax=Nocardiopsis oceanisediminis TaxID=2816862 RepID=UPI003B2D647E